MSEWHGRRPTRAGAGCGSTGGARRGRGGPDGPFMGWADGPLCGLDIKTTGGDLETARIVAIALAFVGDKTPIANLDVLVDPGVPIPAEASAVHGITTAQVRAHGLRPAEALQQLANRLGGAWGSGRAVIGFDIAPALTVLDRELRRHLGAGLAVTGPVVDPHVIDRTLDRREGDRSLAATCRHYDVRHGADHDPVQDALAAARLAWRLAKRHPTEVGRPTAAALHRAQIDWTRTAAGSAAAGAVDGAWPMRPYVVTDTRDQKVIKAIHHKIRTDWEHSLRTKGPQPFRPELHIVNDTRDAHPYFTSIRVLANNIGHDDSFSVALMGALANSMAADRVVVAWEPHALELSTSDFRTSAPRSPAGRERTLMVVDLVSGRLVRWARYPYTSERVHPGDRHPVAIRHLWDRTQRGAPGMPAVWRHTRLVS
ncbi:hypothetical protein Dvina_17305 [Dactylosporangium vinaceum]|nr:exonuclease domain-containing protein [Dactylosporangium vinaceum]UAB99667.1 hypothetical protein Dvina_17305 [Dactylosporangium vinaceum]